MIEQNSAGNHALTYVVEEGSSFTYIHNQADDQSPITKFLHFTVKRQGSLHVLLLVTGGDHTTINLTIVLDGPGAQAIVRGLYALCDVQKVMITTVQEHNAPDTKSDVVIKGLVNCAAQSKYHGTIRVNQQAKNTVAIQENKNMLLSVQAQAHSMPTLEVLTNQVHCTHGSAAGFVDEQMLLYAQARGLSEKQAQSLVLQGFCAHIINAVPAHMVDDLYARIALKTGFKQDNEYSR